jgi:hypothetical protein
METAGCEPCAILITWTVKGQKNYFVSVERLNGKLRILEVKTKWFGERGEEKG